MSIVRSVGAITNRVRKKAIPTRIWFGGVDGVPSAFRTKPSTIRMRVKPVTAKSTPGSTVISVSRTRIWTGVETPPALTLVAETTVTGAPSGAAARRRTRGRRAGRRLPPASGQSGSASPSSCACTRSLSSGE